MLDTGTAKKVMRSTMNVRSDTIEKVKVGILVNPAKKQYVKNLLQLYLGIRCEGKPKLCFY